MAVNPAPASIHAAIQLRKITRRYGRSFVLRGLDWDLPTGQCAVLYGHNGAGKTTLLRILAGALAVSSGEGRIFGYDLKDGLAVRQHSHLLGHQQGLYPELTVLENLKFALQLHQVNTADTSSALERVGLIDVQHQWLRTLSAGMRKRLCLARLALVPSPLLLIDEPFANLDSAGKTLAIALLSELKQQGRTLVISSHEPELSNSLADHVGTLQGGLWA